MCVSGAGTACPEAAVGVRGHRWMERGRVSFMPSFAEEKIQAYVGPPELGAADDLEQVIVDFIAGTKTRLDIAVQEIDSRPIALRHTSRVARSGISLPLAFVVRCGRTASSRSGGPPRTAVRRAGGSPLGRAPS